jgi:hypothetical protein
MTRSHRTLAVTAACTATLCLIAFYVRGNDNQPNFGPMAKRFGGPENVRLIRATTKVEVYRVAGFRARALAKRTTAPSTSPTTAPTPTAAGYPVLAGPVTLDPAAARRLAAAVTDPANYQFEMYDACMFDPGYVARFTTPDGGPVFEVAFCFHCDDVLVTPVGRFLSMMPGHDRLLALLQSAFPADSPK